MDSRILYVPQKENNAIITLNSQIINSLYSKNVLNKFMFLMITQIQYHVFFYQRNKVCSL